MKQEDCFLLGKIIKSSGLKGQVHLQIDADDPGRYNELESVFVEINKQLVPFFIESISIKSNGLAYVKFRDVDTVEKADALRKSDVFLPSAMLEELDEDNYYFHELTGFDLCDEHGHVQGKIIDVMSAGNQHLAVVAYHNREALFPLNNHLFRKILRERKQIHFSVPEGLLDIYTQKHGQPDDRD